MYHDELLVHCHFWWQFAATLYAMAMCTRPRPHARFVLQWWDAKAKSVVLDGAASAV